MTHLKAVAQKEEKSEVDIYTTAKLSSFSIYIYIFHVYGQLQPVYLLSSVPESSPFSTKGQIVPPEPGWGLIYFINLSSVPKTSLVARSLIIKHTALNHKAFQ